MMQKCNSYQNNLQNDKNLRFNNFIPDKRLLFNININNLIKE